MQIVRIAPAHADGPDQLSKPQGVGYGIGLAFALFVMQQAASMVRIAFFVEIFLSPYRVPTVY